MSKDRIVRACQSINDAPLRSALAAALVSVITAVWAYQELAPGDSPLWVLYVYVMVAGVVALMFLYGVSRVEQAAGIVDEMRGGDGDASDGEGGD